MEEIEDDTKKWKDMCVIGLEELILLKCPYQSKQHTNLMQSLSEYPGHFSQDQKKNKIYMEVLKNPNSQSSPEGKKNKAGNITCLDFRLYY